jgi:polyhydroxyalkanoate synthesis repressor PhaR
MADRKSSPVTIKKYANRRLYNTATSTYVTLEDLAKMVKEGTEFNVYDAKSGEDITRSVLTQIIMEAENSGSSMLPVPFLRQLIGFYGGNMEPMLGKYLEQSLSSFSGNQEKMRELMTQMTGGMFPVGSIEEMGKQNMAMFERTMKMFTPMAGGDVQEAGKRLREQSEKSLAELQDQLDKLQRQIGDIMKGGRR